MNKFKIFSLISMLLIILIYTTNLTTIPSNIILLDGEEPNINTVIRNLSK